MESVQTKQNREREIEFWDTTSKRERDWVENTPVTEIIDSIMPGTHAWADHWWEPLIGKITGKKILDIGCGDTYFAAYWQMTGNDASGSDFSPETVKTNVLLHEKLGLKHDFYVASAEKIESPDDSLDLIHMRWVVHHIPEELLDTAMQEMKRVLKPGGRLIIYETNYGYPFRWIVQTPLLRKYNPFRRYALKIHLLDPEEKALTNRGYISLLRRNGFTIRKMDYNFNFFNYPVCVMTKNEQLRALSERADRAIRNILPTAFSKDIKVIAEKAEK